MTQSSTPAGSAERLPADSSPASAGSRAGFRLAATLLAGLTIIAVLGVAVASARAAYAPIDLPGPPLGVPTAKLAAALSCTGSVEHAKRAPVLLVPGSGSTPAQEFSWNYEPALTRAGIPWCAVTLPSSANDDIQIAGEYVVYAIRTVHARAGRRVSLIGHSQGGMVPRWALRFWPDTRAMVDDLIGIAPSNNGSVLPHYTCGDGCSPADWQQGTGSNFLRALNSIRETFPGISYSVILSRFDEEDIPPGTLPLSRGAAVSNIYVQDVCPGDRSEHLGLGTYDPVAYALAIDALSHPGPADARDIPLSVCAQQFMPGVNPATFPQDSAAAAYEDETSPSPTLYREPPLLCYPTASCRGASAAALRIRLIGRAPRLRAHRRSVIRVLVDAREGGVLVPVPEVALSLGARRILTSADGQATFLLSPSHAGPLRLIAARAGCRAAVMSLRVAR